MEHRTTWRKRNPAPARAQRPQQHTPAHPTGQDTQTSQSTVQPVHQGKEKPKERGSGQRKKKERNKQQERSKRKGKKRGRGQKEKEKKKQRGGPDRTTTGRRGPQHHGRKRENSGDKGAKKEKKGRAEPGQRTTRRQGPRHPWPENTERQRHRGRKKKTAQKRGGGGGPQDAKAKGTPGRKTRNAKDKGGPTGERKRKTKKTQQQPVVGRSRNPSPNTHTHTAHPSQEWRRTSGAHTEAHTHPNNPARSALYSLHFWHAPSTKLFEKFENKIENLSVFQKTNSKIFVIETRIKIFHSHFSQNLSCKSLEPKHTHSHRTHEPGMAGYRWSAHTNTHGRRPEPGLAG